MSHIMLQHNEHNSRQGNHPQQGVPEVRSCRKIRSPVARIYKTNGHKQTGTNIFKEIQSTKITLVVLTS